MSRFQSSQMSRERFLRISVNLLFKTFIEASRTEAKKLFREIEDGTRVALTEVVMEDGGRVRFDVSLNTELHRGTLNWGGFRRGLLELLQLADKTLNEERKITVFSGKEDPNQMIFGILGTTVEGEHANVLALGANSSAAGAVELRLMYLDYSQFADAAAAGVPAAGVPAAGGPAAGVPAAGGPAAGAPEAGGTSTQESA